MWVEGDEFLTRRTWSLPASKSHLIPRQLHQFRNPEPVTECGADHEGVPEAVVIDPERGRLPTPSWISPPGIDYARNRA